MSSHFQGNHAQHKRNLSHDSTDECEMASDCGMSQISQTSQNLLTENGHKKLKNSTVDTARESTLQMFRSLARWGDCSNQRTEEQFPFRPSSRRCTTRTDLVACVHLPSPCSAF